MRKRIDAEDVERIFRMSFGLHGKVALEETVHIDTTVQEKNTTCPTDSKLAIKIINRLNKLARVHGISQRRTYVKEVKSLSLSNSFATSRKEPRSNGIETTQRTIAGILILELRQHKLPQHCLFECYQRDFVLYERILKQQIKDTDKIHSLHEPQVYCVAKGRNHKQYEYGSKASTASTARSNIIVVVVSHE